MHLTDYDVTLKQSFSSVIVDRKLELCVKSVCATKVVG